MVVGNRTKIQKLKLDRTFRLNGKNIQYVTQFTYLGIILDHEFETVAS